jgi:hypothetical protein
LCKVRDYVGGCNWYFLGITRGWLKLRARNGINSEYAVNVRYSIAGCARNEYFPSC